MEGGGWVGESPGGPWHGPSAPAQCRPKCSTGGQAEHMVPFLNPMATISWTPGIDSPRHGELVAGSPKNLGTGKRHARPGGLLGLAGSLHAGQAGDRRLADGLGGEVNRYERLLPCSTCREERMGPWMASFGLGMGPVAPAAAPSHPSDLHRASTASSRQTAMGITFQPGGISWQTRLCPDSPRPVEHDCGGGWHHQSPPGLVMANTARQAAHGVGQQGEGGTLGGIAQHSHRIRAQTRILPDSSRPLQHENPVGPAKLDRHKPPRPPGIRLAGTGLRVHLKDSKTTGAWVSQRLA